GDAHPRLAHGGVSQAYQLKQRRPAGATHFHTDRMGVEPDQHAGLNTAQTKRLALDRGGVTSDGDHAPPRAGCVPQAGAQFPLKLTLISGGRQLAKLAAWRRSLAKPREAPGE